jgi:tetratricopeptide (TPR) repeat protein
MRLLMSVIVSAVFSISIATAAWADEAAPALIANGHVDEAIAALQGRISTSPNDALAHNLLCRAFFSLGDWDQGISECERAVSLAPANGQFHLWLGRVYGEKADKSGLIKAASLARKVRNEFETAVHLNPKSVDARSDLAEFYLEAPSIVGGGRDKAEQQANSLAALDPSTADWIKARIAEKQGDFTAAERDYQQAITASHGSASTWLNLGLFYKHRAQYDPMERALLHVRTAALDRPDALVDAAEILIHTQRNLPESVQLLRTYLSSTSKVEQAPLFKVYYLLGSADEKLGERKNAAHEYQTALDLAHEFRPAQEGLQRVNR